MVQTVDVITPLVDDPFTFGAISAANSLSDVYAMGGTPVSALAVLGFASCDFTASAIKNLLKGAIAKLREAGASLIGGHSIEDNELKFGLSVIGRVDRNKILRANAAAAGDILVLTKPIGTGVLSSAFKKGVIRDSAFKTAVASMLMLNRAASVAAVSAGARAATDVTGFGLLGHALNMVKGRKVNLVIFNEQVPLLNKVNSLAASGIAPKGAHSNLKFVSNKMTFSKNIAQEQKLILSDPQTSGGLLIALPKKSRKKFEGIAKRNKMPYWVIGEAVKGKGKVTIK
ncbi:selenide, water dikinase [bacterium BMS3Abin10]|nr:selenide, water dikinase [bacterium BMS3Abin10]GBE37689.1 selenide, water dikinase [bacterium BMS3Bbin08]